jgi:hypothetical protein
MNLYDYNIHAENALIPIINTVYGLQVSNVNSNGKRNFPAIDLADDNNRIAFQVTVTTGIEKVKNTLESFKVYELHKKYDTLYIFVLTQKQKSYSQDALKGILPADYDFDVKNHIIDFSNIREKIIDIQSLEKLAHLAKLCEHEFSDIQIGERKKRYQENFLKNEPEKLFLNFLKIDFPTKLFIAELDFDEEACLNSINEYRRIRRKPIYSHFKPEALLREAMRLNEVYSTDYIIRENKIITFRNLDDTREPLRKVIDVGTIDPINTSEYFNTNESYVDNFKHLLRQTVIDLGYSRGLEWIGSKNLLRFRNSREMPRAVKKSWKKRNQAVKTVIFEMINKKERHVVCFRNMAFEPSFENIGEEWFMVINPTWSFTNPYGYKTSKYEASYMAGIKRQERNTSVYYQYRFWCYFFMYPDMQSPNSLFLHFEPFEPFDFSPSIEDSKWLPQKEFKPQNERESELEIDNELSMKFFE